jgi:16S rRNA C967 or C1407 C5-methylase (RsmB/RsmF family)
MTVFDVCAAPGAKTTYLAQLMQNQGMICSVDFSKRRMQVWRQEVGRMWVNIATRHRDARNPLPFSGEADVVFWTRPAPAPASLPSCPRLNGDSHLNPSRK